MPFNRWNNLLSKLAITKRKREKNCPGADKFGLCWQTCCQNGVDARSG